jgi:HEAT repeat protein
MLGELSCYPARKMVCDLLVEKATDRVDIIGSAISDSRWYVVRNIVWVLGEGGFAGAVSFLTRVTAHPDERVRSEVVKSLGKINDEKAVTLLVDMLQDESERIVTMVAHELGGTGSPIAYEALEEIVSSKEFGYLPVVKMRQFAEALVRANNSRALERIARIANQRAWFGRARLRQTQEVLVNALQFADNPETEGWLDETAQQAKSHLAVTAKKALLQIKARQSRDANYKQQT